MNSGNHRTFGTILQLTGDVNLFLNTKIAYCIFQIFGDYLTHSLNRNGIFFRRMKSVSMVLCENETKEIKKKKEK